MAEPKTKPTTVSVESFINSLKDEARRDDCRAVIKLMKQVTGEEPKMWGTSIVGFGMYRYKYASGREGDWPLAAFSPRKQNLTLYIMDGFEERDALMKKLGKFKTGKVCIYVKSLSDIHLPTLKTLVQKSMAYVKKKYS